MTERTTPRLGGTTVAIVGASGFVGEAVAAAFRSAGATVREVGAPRLSVAPGTEPSLAAAAWAIGCTSEHDALLQALTGAGVVVNAAGLATPTAPPSPELWGANAVLPRVLAEASDAAGAARFVHISSAAVSGSVEVLDESPFVAATTPYASSKGAGELALAGFEHAVVYRPTSVLGATRPIAQRLAGVLQARWLIVPRVDPPLPVALVQNVGDAVVHIATLERPPSILVHPSEGMTVGRLADAFGRSSPLRTLPSVLMSPMRWCVRFGVRRGGPLAGKLRRLEMLWEGQRQRSSLPGSGFDPGDQTEAYRALGLELARRAAATE